jgi:hypothetical protein
MLEILGGPWVTPGSKMLEKHIDTPIEEDDEGLYEFSRRQGCLPNAHFAPARLKVPCPAQVGEASHPSSQRQQSVPEEYSSFDKVCKSVEDILAALKLC